MIEYGYIYYSFSMFRVYSNYFGKSLTEYFNFRKCIQIFDGFYSRFRRSMLILISDIS